MRKLLRLLGLLLIIIAILSISLIGTGFDCNSESSGPAPNSGDGIPDGPGW